jgi:hypothetical protein
VHWNVPRLKEYNGKWYPKHLNAWKVDKNSATSAPPAEAPADEFEDDVPFNRD